MSGITTPSRDRNCPHCGAKVGRNWRSCWLCGLELPAGPQEGAAPPAHHAAGEPASNHGTIATVLRIVGYFLAAVIALIMLGLIANGEIGGLMLLVILLTPAGIVTLTKSLNRRSRGEELTVAEKAGTFALSLAVTVGAVAAVGLAAFVALCIFCFAILAGGGVDFR